MMVGLVEQPVERPKRITDYPTEEDSIPILTLENFTYRGEGNAHLVLSLPNKGSIVRLRKCSDHEVTDLITVKRNVDFVRKIMQRLLGDKYVVISDLVRISPVELVRLKELLKNVRPACRLHKSVFPQYATVSPDLCLLSTSFPSSCHVFCVEVKPKQGWVPVPDRRLSKCSFCLKQYWKLLHGVTSEKSEYCPLDLFSGDTARMKKAITALVQSPQNNFRIFCDGTLIYGEGSDSYLPALKLWFGSNKREEELIQDMCSVLYEALTSDECGSEPIWPAMACKSLHPVPHLSSESQILQQLVDEAAALLTGNTCYRPEPTANSLPEHCILNKILQVQKLDISGPHDARLFYPTTPSTNYNYVANLLNENATIEELLHRYLVSAVAKDCSIMITFRETTDMGGNRNVASASKDCVFDFNIGLADLDPKPASCIEMHRKRDLKVIQSCINWLKTRSTEDQQMA